MSVRKEEEREFLSYIAQTSRKLLKWIKETESCLIVTHYDADGICAASIISKLLLWTDVSFHIKVFEQLDEGKVNWIKENSHYDYIIVTDMGSGQKSLINVKLSDRHVLILDHHIPETSNLQGGNVVELNPHNFNIDGSTQASSSVIAYLLAKHTIPERAHLLSPLGVIGALGDRQDQGKHFSLTGMNKIAVDDGVKHGLIKTELGLRLFGLRSRPLLKCLEYTFDPYIPGLSGNEVACYNFLRNVGIEPVEGGKLRYFNSLTREEVRRLATELIKHSISVGLSVKESERIFGVLYLLTEESPDSPLHDAREFAMVLNACGRTNRHDLALIVAMGHRGKFLEQALKEVEEYRKRLSRILNEIKSNRSGYIEEYDHLVILDVSGRVDSKMLAAVASLLASSKVWNVNKPLLAITSLDENAIKVSFRKPLSVETKYKDINLGKLLSGAARKLGGTGGGHGNAAGGTFKADLKQALISYLNDNISKAIG